jgi:hypothetical protein
LKDDLRILVLGLSNEEGLRMDYNKFKHKDKNRDPLVNILVPRSEVTQTDELTKPLIKKYKVDVSLLNIREKPNGNIVGKLKRDIHIETANIEDSEGWLKIESKEVGKSGYVLKKYLKEL